jgi:hypothetical protein
VGHADGTVIVWDLDPEAWARTACAVMAPAAATSTVRIELTDAQLCPPAPQPSGSIAPPIEWAGDAARRIANATLIAPTDYAPLTVDDSAVGGIRFDAEAAGGIPGCRADLDAVFETERHGAVTATKKISSLRDHFDVNQYVAVLPDERAAAAMLERLGDKGFAAACLRLYADRLAPGGLFRPVGMPRVGYIPFFGDACEPPPVPRVGDASSVVCVERTYDRTVPGGPPGAHEPGRYDVATIQVGRTVVIMEIARTIAGVEVATDTDVADLMTRLATRATQALEAAEPS